MREHWNDQQLKNTYIWEIEDALTMHGLNEEELQRTDIGDIADHKSKRIEHIIKVAYFRGILQGIKDADEMKDVIRPSQKSPRT